MTAEEKFEFAKNLRQVDKDELDVLGSSIHHILEVCQHTKGHFYYMADDEGNPIAICGLEPIHGEDDDWFGAVWLLCTDLVEKYGKTITQKVQYFLELHGYEFGVYTNLMPADSPNKAFVERLGFVFLDADDELIDYRDNKLMKFEMITKRGLLEDVK
jgi:hypothetical protein